MSPYLFNEGGALRKGLNDLFSERASLSRRQWDAETGYYYYGARYYDAKISLWLSVDPLAEKTMTPYLYCNQSPVMLIDPTGMEGEEPPNEGSNYRLNNNGSITRIGANGRTQDALFAENGDNIAANVTIGIIKNGMNVKRNGVGYTESDVKGIFGGKASYKEMKDFFMAAGDFYAHLSSYEAKEIRLGMFESTMGEFYIDVPDYFSSKSYTPGTDTKPPALYGNWKEIISAHTHPMFDNTRDDYSLSPSVPHDYINSLPYSTENYIFTMAGYSQYKANFVEGSEYGLPPGPKYSSSTNGFIGEKIYRPNIRSIQDMHWKKYIPLGTTLYK